MKQRDELDRYYTPPTLADKLVGLLTFDGMPRVLEPHAGDGAFLRALPSNVRRYCNDIDPGAPALEWGRQMGATVTTGDFLEMPAPLDYQYDWIIGNPPFNNFEKHIDRALMLSPRVAFLLRLAVMESSKRAACWKRWPLQHVWVLAERPSFTGGGTDSAAYGFFYFNRYCQGAATITPGWSWK